jgi:YccS/YhfK family integral membrane protein
MRLLDLFRRIRGSDRYAECVLVFVATTGAVIVCEATGRADAVIPSLLGVIACALAETEDHWRNRIVSLLVTLSCFAVATAAVQWLMPWPWLFALGLPLATFGLVMLGAASARYGTIAGGTLILSVYTMIGVDAAGGTPAGFWHEPALLLAGAAWYGVLSLLWSAISPQRAVRHALARVFDELGAYLDCKAALFEPVRGIDREGRELALAMQNERVVEAMNATRLVLIDRIGGRRPRGATARRLRLYFMVQDIHERVSSAHYPYQALTDALFHHDTMFRCQRLLGLEAGLCRQRADGLRLRTAMTDDPAPMAALDDLAESIDYLRRQANPPAPHLLRSLEALLDNVGTIQAQLDGSAPLMTTSSDSALQNPGPRSPLDAWKRIRIQLTPRSFRFRHALRLALALLAGYGVLRAIHPNHGYWILLTTLFVCQPSYGATRRRLLQRVAGTVTGLVAGWLVLQALPVTEWQLPLIVLTGVLFFATWLRRYTLATASITLFVVLCFNQVGNGYDVMWPRLLDTFIGAAIAALAIRFILPDWQGRRLDGMLAETLRSHAGYLRQILVQYDSGKRDDLDYRIARRDAHNADASLSGLLANMLGEPGRRRRRTDTALRFLAISHSLLGHLSTLGTHRQRLVSDERRALLESAGTTLAADLDALAMAVEAGQPAPVANETPLIDELAAASDRADDATGRLVASQLGLLARQRDRLVEMLPVTEHREGD